VSSLKTKNSQWFILLFTALISICLLLLFETEYLIQSIALLFVVSFGGTWIIYWLSSKLRDTNIIYVEYAFHIKIIIGILLLYLTWTPWLDQSMNTFGYDPQRYYYDAYELVAGNFSPEGLPAINYAGIIYYYGIIFYIFGYNPVIPLLINYAVTLYAVMLLVQVYYMIRKDISPTDWMIGLVLIVPEILWYDLITSRETLVMSLLLISTLTIGGFIIKKPGDSFSNWNAILLIPSVFLLGIVRTPMVFPVLFVSLVYLLFNRNFSFHRLSLLPLAAFSCIAILYAMYIFAESIGSISIANYYDFLKNYIFVENPADPDFLGMEWSEKSLGLLFIPQNWVEALLYAPIRIFFYLVSPLPNIFVGFNGLISGRYDSWQHLMSLISSTIYVVLMPFAIISLWDILKVKKWSDSIVIIMPFWIVMATISLGNQIIHWRYRIMVVPLLICSIMLGIRSEQKYVKDVYVVWMIMLIAGGTFFTVYKYIM